MDFFDYSPSDFIQSELSETKANDVHHIDCRGIGGSKEKDYIENLIALNRSEHEQYGDKKQYIAFLYIKHIEFIISKRPDYEIQYDKIPHIYFNKILEITNNLKNGKITITR